MSEVITTVSDMMEQIEGFRDEALKKEVKTEQQATSEKPKRKRAARKMPELWAVVEMLDGSKQAYTCVSKALQVAGEAMVREVQLCRISPKSRGFKVVEVVKV